MKIRRFLLLTATLMLAMELFSLCSVAGQPERRPASFPQAKEWLKKMSDYMDTLDRFQVHVQTTRELVFPRGGIINEDAYGDIYAQRPNRLYVSIFKPEKSRELYYDGSTLTVYTPKLNYYGVLNVPPTTEQMINKVMTEYGINFPLADLLRPNMYNKVLPQIKTGVVVGSSLLNGVYCKQLAFRSDTMEWQIWIENSETPLPRRIVILDLGMKGSPRYMATLSNWNTQPTFDDSIFKFTPPEGAQKIGFVKQGGPPAQTILK